MITPIPTNYFSQRSYLKSEPETGLLFSRQGNRLIAIPDVLLRSIHRSLRTEAGEATPLALYTCGFWWGGAFYDRIIREIESYYQTSIKEMNALEFLVTMRELWAVHGLGNLALDFSYRSRGIVQITTSYSILQEGSDQGLKPGQQPSYHLEAGFLAAWFSRWAGKELKACATDWGFNRSEEAASSSAAMASTIPFTQFLVGASELIESIEGQVRQGQRTAGIIEQLSAMIAT